MEKGGEKKALGVVRAITGGIRIVTRKRGQERNHVDRRAR